MALIHTFDNVAVFLFRILHGLTAYFSFTPVFSLMTVKHIFILNMIPQIHSGAE